MCVSVHVHGVCVCKGGEQHWGHAWLMRCLATFGHGLDRKAIIKERSEASQALASLGPLATSHSP